MKKDINVRPTSIDYAILGLVSHEPLSGYGIRKIFETTALGNYSNSPGTIYPALKRLQNFALIEKLKDKNASKEKFHITSTGRQFLRDWLLKPLEMNDVSRKKDEIFLRFAFLDNIRSHKQKVVFLRSFHDLLIAYIKQLQNYHREESPKLPLHGRLSFEHGIESYKTTLKWCKKTLLLFTKNNQK